MSTQQTLSPAAKAAPYRAFLALALWGWLIGLAAVSFCAWRAGAAYAEVAAAASLAAAPALVGFVLLPRLCRSIWADAAFVGAWIVTGAGLVAGGGGAASPLVMVFAIAPSLSLALGRRWAPEAGAAAVLGYAFGAFLYQTGVVKGASLGAFPELIAVTAMALAAAFMALGQGGRRSASEHTMGRRIAEVSHELRTPLTHILGFSEMIERQIFGPIGERYVEYAGLIRRSGGHLLGLVNDLLDLSKIEAGRYELERETFDARAVIEDVVRLSIDAAEKKSIVLGMTTPDAPLLVSADERALRRILINTVGNALKFTPEGGRVVVAAAARDEVLTLDTIDNGPGIPEDERARLGQAFERGVGGARAEGTGLGLALVRALATLHGGALSFHEAPGGGALVRVELPVIVRN